MSLVTCQLLTQARKELSDMASKGDYADYATFAANAREQFVEINRLRVLIEAPTGKWKWPN